MAPQAGRTGLCLALVLSLQILSAAGASPSRSLLQTSSTSTVTVTVPSNCNNQIVAPANNGLRAGCSSCGTTGTTTYSVDQGTSQTVQFSYADDVTLMGGSYYDQFLAQSDGCFVTAMSQLTTTANANPVNISTITSITFAPTLSVCAQFTNNVEGSLTLLAFTNTGTGNYVTTACKFNLIFNIVPSSTGGVSPSQLYPEANAADALPGSFLKMLAMAVVGGGVILFMLL